MNQAVDQLASVAVEYRVADASGSHHHIRDIVGVVERPEAHRHIVRSCSTSGEASARAERRLLAAAVENTSESVRVTDRDGVILYVNPAFKRLGGLTSAEIVGRNTTTIAATVRPADRAWRLAAGGAAWSDDLAVRRKDGSAYTEEAPVTPVPYPLPLGGWALDHEAAAILAREVATTLPGTVVELGSGTSTLVIVLQRRRTGCGHVYSLEHDAAYAERTRRHVRALGLEAVSPCLTPRLFCTSSAPRRTPGARSRAWSRQPRPGARAAGVPPPLTVPRACGAPPSSGRSDAQRSSVQCDRGARRWPQ
jgi:PAS domain S-box-containing protein